MSLEKHRGEIAHCFGDAAAADHALVEECMSMCRMYSLTVEDLSFKWQALSFSNTRALAVFSLQSVPELKAKLQQDLGRLNATKLEAVSRTAAGPSFGRGRGKRGAFTKAPLAGPLKIGPLRPGVIKSETTDFSNPSRVEFLGPKSDEKSLKRRAYRYMYEKVTERSEALDDRIDEFSYLVQRHYHIEELADPGAATNEVTTVVGRIVHDADGSVSGTKLHETSLLLESSRMMGSGVRIPIRFAPEVKLRGGVKAVGGMSLFLGAIVALRGRNGGGGFFLVEELLSLPPIKLPRSPPNDPSATFSMCIACGPFSLDSDLEYRPWAGLIEHLKSTRPAVILLVGPFVDATNRRIQDGDTDETPKQLFERHFTRKLQKFLAQSPGSLVLLVPSINDMISDHAAFPQCELEPEFSQDSRICLLPNPCRFSVNGISFGVTSVDTLFHICKEQVFKRTPEIDPLIPASEPVIDAMSNLARNVLQQRSFYPLFPTPSDVSHEVNLDVTHWEGTRLIESEDECAPNVLVLPSRLTHFSKFVDGTTVVNPSFLSKNTYAMLSYVGQGSALAKDQITADILRI